MRTIAPSAALLLVLLLESPAQSSTVVNGWLDVKDFGALGNDSTDDTAAIQSAANSMTTGSVLYFPPGIYRVSSVITFGGSGIVAGAGMERSIIRATNATMNVFSTTGTTGRVIFRDFKIDTAVAKTNGAGVLMTTADPLFGAQQHARVENVWIDAQYRGIYITNVAYWTIRDCAVSNSVAEGIRVNVTSNPDAGDNLLSGCVISGGTSGTGVMFETGGQKMIGNKILGHYTGLLVQPAAPNFTIVDVMVSNNSIENQSAYGTLWQTPTSGSGVSLSHLVNNQFAGQSQGGAAIAISGNIGGLVLSNNLVSLNSANTYAIGLFGNGLNTPGQVTITNNNVSGNGSAGTVGISVGNIPSAEIHGNWVADGSQGVGGVVIGYQYVAGRISDATFTSAALPAAANGSVVYCSDCTLSCGGGGTGAFARRINGSWTCN